MSGLKAIQTEYKGYKFRSRLEARWAVFLDALGVKWEYEPEGYDLGNGICYLPDFRLYDVTINHGYFKRHCTIYLEVKGQMNNEDAAKIKRFYELGYDDESHYGESKSAVLVVGNIPEGEDMRELLDYMQDEAYGSYGNWPSPYNFETVDGDYFAAYPGVDQRGTFTLFGDDSNYLWSMDEHKTENAYRLARQARFEYGDTPKRRMLQ